MNIILEKYPIDPYETAINRNEIQCKKYKSHRNLRKEYRQVLLVYTHNISLLLQLPSVI